MLEPARGWAGAPGHDGGGELLLGNGRKPSISHQAETDHYHIIAHQLVSDKPENVVARHFDPEVGLQEIFLLEIWRRPNTGG